MSFLYDDETEGVQWAFSSPTSYSAPVEFSVGSSQWSLQSVSDVRFRRGQSSPLESLGSPVGTGPQWTFQHVDSTLRNTILPPRSQTSPDTSPELGVTAFPISRSSSFSSTKQRPRIVIDSPPLLASSPRMTELSGSNTPMFPPRDKVRDLDSPMLGLFRSLLPLSPALSSDQFKLVPPPAWSPATPNTQLLPPPPSAISTTATPRATFMVRLPPALESDSDSDSEPEPEETPLLRQTLDSLDDRLRELLEERAQVQNRLLRAANKRSPVSRLPTEILARIFELGVNGSGMGFGPGFEALTPVSETAGLFFDVVCRVCKLWKEVAESTPSLWSSITIDTHNSLKSAQVRLKRSCSVPLDIQIVLSDRFVHAGNVSGALTDAFGLLKPHMNRWRTLRVQVPESAHAQVAFESCSGSAPQLQEFSVQVGNTRPLREVEELPWLFENTSALKELSLSSVNLGWDAMRFENLTSLSLSDYWDDFTPSSLELLDILQSCATTLTDLTLRNMSESDTDEELRILEDLCYMPQVVLPRLKRATLYFIGNSRLTILLGRIALPVLESLELSYLDDVSMALEMLCQQRTEDLPLRNLTINSSLVSEDQLVQLLERLPELTTLELSDCEDISPYLLNELSNPNDWLCPGLRVLSIDGCTCVDSISIRTFVTSRLPSQQSVNLLNKVQSRPIEELHISRCLGISSDAVQWLRMYVPIVHREF